MPGQTEFESLLEALITDRITTAQREALNELLRDPAFAEQVKQRLHQELDSARFSPEEDNAYYNLLLGRIQEGVTGKIKANTPVRKINWIRYAAAAVLLFAVAITYFLITEKKNHARVIALTGDVAPGKTGAILKLANGIVINLDTAKNGELFKGVSKSEHTLLISAGNEMVQYATLETPFGRTIDVALPDGTKVWLNSGSSIRFPTAFTGNAREVAMTGEVYFEVFHNEKSSFRVKMPDGSFVEDIGTHFNVNAYSDEPSTKTTLLEGAVTIKNTVLQPGEQYNNGSVKQVNTDEVMAWKNGSFSLNNKDLKTVLRELARWYNVEVVFENEEKIPNILLGGDMGRDLNLSQALRVLEKLKVNARIEGRKLVVMP
jgi:hypothetical protein